MKGFFLLKLEQFHSIVIAVLMNFLVQIKMPFKRNHIKKGLKLSTTIIAIITIKINYRKLFFYGRTVTLRFTVKCNGKVE